MNWLKKWGYLLLWTITGVIYLTAADNWQVYAKPLGQLEQQLEGWLTGEKTGQETTETKETETGAENGIGAEKGKNGENGIEIKAQQTASPEMPKPPSHTVSGSEGILHTDKTPPTGTPQETVPQKDYVVETVEDDYFADAVFIGDSRTVGMFEYGGLEETAAFYASTGLTIYKLFDAEIVPVEGEKKKITVEQALSENHFSKIYLMIGINEMGTGTVESFTKKYAEAVNHLLELQPDAILYIQGIMKVTTERSEKGDYINNEGIQARNEALSQLADGKRIFYLDVNPEICDETGGMEASYTFDGVHLKAQYISIWKEFLKKNAVVKIS